MKVDLNQQLEINRRLIGSSAIVTQKVGARDISVELDVAGFIRRLLLFDTYVLYSVRLKEIPEIVRHFGYQGTLALLSSGALEIRCECAQYAEGQFGTPPCAPLTFQFHVIEAHGRHNYLVDNLKEVNRTPALNSRELMELQSAVVGAVRQPDNREMFRSLVAPTFESDVLQNSALLKAAIRFVLEKENGMKEIPDFDIRLHKVGDDRYKAETTLTQQLTLHTDELHQLMKSSLLGIAGVDQRLGEMNAHNALSGFTLEEVPLFSSKLASLAEAVSSQRTEERFQRVVAIAGLSDVVPDCQIDAEKLLEIRNQPEAMEFRAWLSGIDKFSDSEISELVASLNSKIGLLAQTTVGKALRLAVTTAVGLLPPHVGLPAGVVLGVLDQFAWDKFARRSGVSAFISEMYPSVFLS
jgi:hypothetical protein